MHAHTHTNLREGVLGRSAIKKGTVKEESAEEEEGEEKGSVR